MPQAEFEIQARQLPWYEVRVDLRFLLTSELPGTHSQAKPGYLKVHECQTPRPQTQKPNPSSCRL